MNGIPRGAVEFFPRTHTYVYRGVTLPSVTQILSDLKLSPSYLGIDRFYADRGTALHRTIQLFSAGDLDEESVPSPISSRFDQFLDLWYECGVDKVLLCEEPMASVYGYAGSPDMLVTTTDNRIVHFDWKSGKRERSHHLQAGGYLGMILESGIIEESVESRLESYVVYLDGKKRAETEKVDVARAVDLFRSAAKLYSWKTKR